VTVDTPKPPGKLSAQQRAYLGALSFWIAEFGHSSPYSQMQREKEEKEKQDTTGLAKPAPIYRLGMGHAYAIVGVSVSEQLKTYRKNLARHNAAIFETRLRLYAHEADEVHDYLKQRFAQASAKEYDVRVRDLDSALEAVLKAGFCFSPIPIWPTVTEESRRNPPGRPADQRYIKNFDTWTYTG